MKKFNHVPLDYSEVSDRLLTENIDGKRYYVTPEGNKYVSITSLLSNLSKASILEWRKRVGEAEANKISTRASRRGTSLHSICEAYLRNESDILKGKMPHVVEMFESIRSLVERIDNIHMIEGALWSDHFGVAGRTDVIAEFDGRLSVIDYKTSSRIKTRSHCESYFMQGSFYAIAFEERTGIPVDQIVIIMAVENEEPILFIEKRDDWADSLTEVVNKYR